MPVLIILRLEKCIAQRNSLDSLHINVRHEFRIDIEENRHIHRLARIQPLLLKAKALDLAEIWRHLSRRYRVCCNPNDIFVRLVGRGVERQGGFAG